MAKAKPLVVQAPIVVRGKKLDLRPGQVLTPAERRKLGVAMVTDLIDRGWLREQDNG